MSPHREKHFLDKHFLFRLLRPLYHFGNLGLPRGSGIGGLILRTRKVICIRIFPQAQGWWKLILARIRALVTDPAGIRVELLNYENNILKASRYEDNRV